MAASLSALREALAALGESTATGSLRGEERRAELLRRLHAAHGRSSSSSGPTDSSRPSIGGDALAVETRTLSELRLALEARQLPTCTPGLKGDARRHALAQRLLNAQSGADGRSSSSTSRSDGDRTAAWMDKEEEKDEDDAQSVASASSSNATVYSTAREFLFFDAITDEQRATEPAVPPLQLPASNRRARQSTMALVKTDALREVDRDGERELEALMERRQELHALRREQQRQVEALLDRAGFPERLEQLSSRLQVLARERQRLEHGFLSHELVTSQVLGALSTTSIDKKRVPEETDAPRVLELVQQDALELLRRHQRSTRQLLDCTKQAVAIAKTARRLKDAEDGDAAAVTSSRSARERALEREIRELEVRIQRQSALSSRSFSSVASCTASEPLGAVKDAEEHAPVLARCRSVPHAMFLHEWKQLTLEQRQQLHAELRHAAYFHIRSDRVCIQELRPQSARAETGCATSPTTASQQQQQQPSQADRLGVKARFLEASNRSPLEIHRAYQAALAADRDHVPNLVHYAAFLAFRLSNKAYSDQVEQLLQHALAVEPSNAQALASYAKFLSRVRVDATKAATYFEQVLDRLDPGDPSRADVMGEFAHALLLPATSSNSDELGSNASRLEKALKLLTDALESAPGHLDNQRRLLRVLCEVGDVEQAEQRFRRLVSALAVQNQQHKTRVEHSEATAELARYFARCLAAAGHTSKLNRAFKAQA